MLFLNNLFVYTCNISGILPVFVNVISSQQIFQWLSDWNHNLISCFWGSRSPIQRPLWSWVRKRAVMFLTPAQVLPGVEFGRKYLAITSTRLFCNPVMLLLTRGMERIKIRWSHTNQKVYILLAGIFITWCFGCPDRTAGCWFRVSSGAWCEKGSERTVSLDVPVSPWLLPLWRSRGQSLLILICPQNTEWAPLCSQTRCYWLRCERSIWHCWMLAVNGKPFYQDQLGWSGGKAAFKSTQVACCTVTLNLFALKYP